MTFTARFTSICRISPGSFTAKRCWNTFAIDTLPLPGYPAFSGIISCHPTHNLLPTTFCLPGLKAFMQNAARNTKPFSFQRFPLTACPHDVPETIHYVSVRDRWSSWPFGLGFFGQFSFDDPPQSAWHSKVVNILRFCVTIFSQGISFQVGFGNTLLSGYALFFNSLLFFG